MLTSVKYQTLQVQEATLERYYVLDSSSLAEPKSQKFVKGSASEGEAELHKDILIDDTTLE